MIYKKIVEGKIFTTNNNGVIEVYTESEFNELNQKKWWKKALESIRNL